MRLPEARNSSRSGQHQAYRRLGLPAQAAGDLARKIDPELTARSAAHVLYNRRDLLCLQPQRARRIRRNGKRALGGSVDSRAVVSVVVHHDAVRLQAGVVLHPDDELMLDLNVRLRKRVFGRRAITSAALPAHVVRRVLVHRGRARLHGLLVGHRMRPLLVDDLDGAQGVLGDLRRDRRNGSHGVALVLHLFAGELHDGLHALHPLGGRRVDREHLGARVGRHEDLAVEHSRHPHIVRVLGRAGDLRRAVHALDVVVEDRVGVARPPGGGADIVDFDLDFHRDAVDVLRHLDLLLFRWSLRHDYAPPRILPAAAIAASKIWG